MPWLFLTCVTTVRRQHGAAIMPARLCVIKPAALWPTLCSNMYSFFQLQCFHLHLHEKFSLSLPNMLMYVINFVNVLLHCILVLSVFLCHLWLPDRTMPYPREKEFEIIQGSTKRSRQSRSPGDRTTILSRPFTDYACLWRKNQVKSL